MIYQIWWLQMKSLKITNKENQKGTILEMYGSAYEIKETPLKLVLVSLCLITFGTNWAIPFIMKKKMGGWIRW